MKLSLSFAVAVSAAAVMAAGNASAQSYPSKPIEVVIPFSAGGNTDLMARAMQKPLSDILGQPIVPINQPGASATLGTGETARAKPDGYKLALVPLGPIVIQPLLRKLPYEAEALDYICQTYDVPNFLIVPKDSQFKSVGDIVEFAKANPNAFLYGSSGPGTIVHISTLAFLNAAGVTGTHVPFSGSGELSQALLSGTVMAFSDAPGLAVANDLKLMAIYAPERDPKYPDVPTMKELGYDVETSVWGGLIAPGGLPEEVLSKLDGACKQAVETPEYREALGRLQATPTYRSSADFRAYVADQTEFFRSVVQDAGLVKN